MGLPACCSDIELSALPDRFVSDPDDVGLQGQRDAGEVMLKVWANHWIADRDRGAGLGFASASTFSDAGSSRGSGGSFDEAVPMEFDVEWVDQKIEGLPVELRVTAWRWYVCYEGFNQAGCRKAIGRDLGCHVGETKLREWLNMLRLSCYLVPL